MLHFNSEFSHLSDHGVKILTDFSSPECFICFNYYSKHNFFYLGNFMYFLELKWHANLGNLVHDIYVALIGLLSLARKSTEQNLVYSGEIILEGKGLLYVCQIRPHNINRQVNRH